MDHDVDWGLRNELVDGVGKLQLTTFAWLDAAEDVNNRKAQKLAPHGHQVRRRILSRGLSRHVRELFSRSPPLAAASNTP